MYLISKEQFETISLSTEIKVTKKYSSYRSSISGEKQSICELVSNNITLAIRKESTINVLYYSTVG